MPRTPRTAQDLQALLDKQRWPDRGQIRQEYDAAIQYVVGDMQADTERLILERYRGSQSGGDAGDKIEAVTVALVQQYVDEMATAFTGTVERQILGADGKVNDEVTEIVLREMDRTGHDQVMSTLDKYVVLLKSCGLVLGAEVGHVCPALYPPQDIFDLNPNGDPGNQDNREGFVVNRRKLSNEWGGDYDQTFSLIEREGRTDYVGSEPKTVRKVTGGAPNALAWEQPILTDLGQRTGKSTSAPLQPLMIWHAARPVGELIPLGSCTPYRNSRWMNVLYSIVLDVVRFQAGASLLFATHDEHSVAPYRTVGVRHPIIVRKEEEDARYENAANDYGGLSALLHDFAMTQGKSLRLSPGDVSVTQTAESGYARQIANIPKDRARTERTKWYSLMESEYVWPRYASTLVWLGALSEADVRGCTMRTTFHPAPLPVNQLEQIQIEKHDLEIGITTPARIYAERNKISEDAARDALAAMREQPEEDDEPEKVEKENVPGISDLVKSAAAGDVPPDSAKAMLVVLFGLSEEDAARLIDPIADMPEKPKPEPPQPGPQQPDNKPPAVDKTSARKMKLANLVAPKPDAE